MRGVSLIEVVIALAILGAALLPLVTMYQQQHRVAHVNEFHFVARCRAERMLTALQGLEYATLAALAGRGTVPSDMPTDRRPAGGRPLPDSLLPAAVELWDLAGPAASADAVELQADRQRCFRSAAFFVDVEPGLLARIVVVVSWKVPGEATGRPPHALESSVFVGRRDASHLARPQLGGR